MLPLLEFCEQNLAQGTQLVLEKVEKNYEVDILTYSCLNECTLCARKAFCFFEGERLEADTPQELLPLVEKEIQTWLEEYQ